MKVTFRIIALLVSLGITVFAFLPPSLFDGSSEKNDKPKEAKQEAAPKSEESKSTELNAGSEVIYDILGGSQLETGQRAKDELQKVDGIQQKKVDELDKF